MKSKDSKLIKSGNSLYVYIPASLAKDSSFPFKDGDRVNIKVENESLVIKKEMIFPTINQRKNKELLDSLLGNPAFISKHIGKWVIITEGKLFEITNAPEKILDKVSTLSTPILVKEIGKTRKNRTIQWLGGSLQ